MLKPLRTIGSMLSGPDRRRVEPAEDEGFFGPGSVTWKVWASPTSLLMGFQRAVTIEMLDPNLHAAVETSGGVRYRPRTRYERTVRYFALAAFGDTEAAATAADVLVKVHSKAVGNDPVTGGTYDANDPSSQLWIHMTAWHSILYCYERFGPGRLTEEEELRYWEECARAAELQTIDPADVPRSREEVRAYFEEWRPRMAASELAQDMAQFILRSEIAMPESSPDWAKPVTIPLARLIGAATVSTYPRHIRSLLGVRQPRAVDVALQLALRPALATISALPPVMLRMAEVLAPTTAPIVAPVIMDVPARTRVRMTPREAQARYGFEPPAEAHRALRDRQRRRVLDEGAAPSDEGLVESEAHIGAMA